MTTLAYLIIFTLTLTTVILFLLNRTHERLAQTYKEMLEERDRQIVQWKEMYQNQRVRLVALARRCAHYDPTRTGDE